MTVPPMSPGRGGPGHARPAALTYAVVKSFWAVPARVPTPLYIAPLITIPGPNPVTERVGLVPRFPFTTVLPVLVTPAPARTAKLPAVPDRNRSVDHNSGTKSSHRKSWARPKIPIHHGVAGAGNPGASQNRETAGCSKRHRKLSLQAKSEPKKQPKRLNTSGSIRPHNRLHFRPTMHQTRRANGSLGQRKGPFPGARSTLPGGYIVSPNPLPVNGL